MKKTTIKELDQILNIPVGFVQLTGDDIYKYSSSSESLAKYSDMRIGLF